MVDVQLSPLQSYWSGNKEPSITEAGDRSLSKDTLLATIRNELPVVYYFFCFMGQLWPDSSWPIPFKVLQYLWSGTVRIFTIWSFVYGIILIASFSKFIFAAFIGLSISLQAIVLVPSIVSMSKRLNSKFYEVDLDLFTPALYPCFLIYIFSMCCNFGIFIPTYCFGNLTTCNDERFKVLWIGNVIGEFAISALLALNTMFVFVDCGVAIKLIDKLTDAHKDRKMSISLFNEYRANIRYRVTSNYWTYNSVVFIAIINVILLIILAYFHDNSYLLWPVPFIKEIPFVVLSLYYTTTVNEKADKLTKLLGTTLWTNSDIEEDYSRVLFFSNAEADKISFTLSGMRLKKIDLLLRLLASSLAFALGLVKSIVLDH